MLRDFRQAVTSAIRGWHAEPERLDMASCLFTSDEAQNNGSRRNVGVGRGQCSRTQFVFLFIEFEVCEVRDYEQCMSV